jgi:hypothetical protein
MDVRQRKKGMVMVGSVLMMWCFNLAREELKWKHG